MKKFWKLLSRIIFLVVFYALVFLQLSFAEIKDIWQKSKEIKNVELNKESDFDVKKELPLTTINSTAESQLEIFNISQAEIEKNSKEIIFGIYDPAATGVAVNFWSKASPKLFEDLSQSLIKADNNFVTNHLIKKIFFSKVNLSKLEDGGFSYLNFISSFLGNYKDVTLIDSVIDQNNLLLNNEKLLKFLVDENFSFYQIKKSCKYAKQLGAEIKNFELQKFKVFCLVQSNESRKALAYLELMKEAGFKDDFFVQKINYLLGILLAKKGEGNTDTILNIHLSSLSDPEFNPNYKAFDQNLNTTRYFFSSPFVKLVLEKNNNPEKTYTTEEDFELIQFLEKGSSINVFPLEKLLPFYKKIVFGIDDLLTPLDSYSKYHPAKGRALLYQAMLLSRNQAQKLSFILKLKDSYKANSFSSLGDKVYFQHINSITKKYLTEELFVEIDLYKKKFKKKNNSLKINNKFLHKSEVISLLRNSKINKKQIKILNKFSNLIGKKKYNTSKKDLATLHLISEAKVALPGGLKKLINAEEIYIPNKIYNMLEKKQNNLATAEVLKLVQNLKSSDDYVRDFVVINRIFDLLELDIIKNDFNKYELLAS